jgi:hypothetical protein
MTWSPPPSPTPSMRRRIHASDEEEDTCVIPRGIIHICPCFCVLPVILLLMCSLLKFCWHTHLPVFLCVLYYASSYCRAGNQHQGDKMRSKNSPSDPRNTSTELRPSATTSYAPSYFLGGFFLGGSYAPSYFFWESFLFFF